MTWPQDQLGPTGRAQEARDCAAPTAPARQKKQANTLDSLRNALFITEKGVLRFACKHFFFPKVGGGVQNRGVLRIVKIQYILVGLALLWHFVLLWRKRKPNLYYFLTLPRRRLRPVVTIFYASGVTRGQFGVRSYDASILCLMYCLPLNFVLRMNEAH